MSLSSTPADPRLAQIPITGEEVAASTVASWLLLAYPLTFVLPACFSLTCYMIYSPKYVSLRVFLSSDAS